jgi:hypothetical protein
MRLEDQESTQSHLSHTGRGEGATACDPLCLGWTHLSLIGSSILIEFSILLAGPVACGSFLQRVS